MLTKEEESTYDKWRLSQIERAKRFYGDEEGNIPENNKIAYYHTHYIGGSMDAVLLGLSKWRTIVDLYKSIFAFDAPVNKFVYARGHYFEPFVAEQFTFTTHIPHFEGSAVDGKDKGFPFAFAQIDFWCGKDEKKVPLEIKIATYNSDDELSHWGHGCKFNSDGIILEEDNQIPVDYLIQCQKQLWLTDNQYMFLCVWLTAETQVRVYKIYRDDALIKEIQEAEYDFLFNHVIPQVPYEEDSTLLKEKDEDAVFASESFCSACKEIKKLTDEIRDLEVKKENLVNHLKTSMGEHKVAVDAGGNKVANKTNVTVTTFDKDALADDYPEMYVKYLRKRTFIRFTVSKQKSKGE